VLQGRQQRVKIDKSFSEWNSVNGGVPQSTLSGPELFIHMLCDFNTVARCVKYVDDSTLAEVAKKKLKSDKMQEAANQAVSWSKNNNLGINEAKSKEMLISFGKEIDNYLLDMNGTQIERVHQSKLLGVIISDDLKMGYTYSLHKYILPKRT